MINNQKGVAHLFVVLLLIVGIGVTVYLTQFTQVFKPKAVESLSKITDENYETTLNPWGDPWAWKKSPNPNLPINLAAPTHYLTTTDSSGSILERQAEFISKANSPFLYFDSYEPHAEGQNPKSIALLTRVKQLNPNIKALGYFVQWEAGPGYGEILNGANNGNATFESFFVHKKDKPATKDYRLYGRPDHPEWGFSALMDITNPNYRAFVIPKIVENIRSAKMDGVMTDSLFYNFTDTYNSPPSTMPDNYMPDNIKASWPAGMVQFTQELKAAMGPNMYLFGNVNDDQPQFMQNDLLGSGRLDGVIFEDPFNGRPSTDAISKVTNLMNIVDSFGKKSILIVSGAHNNTPYSGSNTTEEKAAHRYFLTAYLMTVRSSNHMFLYFHPSSIFFQYNSAPFFKEWDLNLGGATSAPQNLGNGVYLRRFERGFVYWNPTYNNYTIPDGRDLYNIDNGQEIAGQIVPANNGAIFVTSSLLAEYNRPPALTAPSPSPSPSPVAPGVFTLNTPQTFCSGTNSHVRLSWTAAPNGPQPGINSGYFIYVDGVYQYNALHALTLDDPAPKTPGRTYTYKIEAVVVPNKSSSNEQTVVAANCGVSPTPTFNISEFTDLREITPGAQVFTWNRASGAAHFTLKVDDHATGFNHACDGNNLEGDVCLTRRTENFYTFNFVLGHTYTIQVFQHDSAGTQLGDPLSVFVKAVNPPSPSPSPSPAGKIGDINNDGKVNIFDFNIFVGDYPSRNIRSDVNKDGQVNIFDFNLLLSNFGR